MPRRCRRRRPDPAWWCLVAACALAVTGTCHARPLDSLHGDNHPAVSIMFDQHQNLVYQYDDDGSVKSIELHVWIDGCVAGLDYLVLVEEIEEYAPKRLHQASQTGATTAANAEMNWTVMEASSQYASQIWSQHITMLADRPFFPSLFFKAVFENSRQTLSANDKHRFLVQFALPNPTFDVCTRVCTHTQCTHTHTMHTHTHEHRWCLSTPIPVFHKKSASWRRQMSPSRLQRIALHHVGPDANALHQTS